MKTGYFYCLKSLLTICVRSRSCLFQPQTSKNIDCLTARVYFISTVNGRSKKKRKEAYCELRQQRAHKQNLSNLFLRFDIYGFNILLVWTFYCQVIIIIVTLTFALLHLITLTNFVARLKSKTRYTFAVKYSYTV